MPTDRRTFLQFAAMTPTAPAPTQVPSSIPNTPIQSWPLASIASAARLSVQPLRPGPRTFRLDALAGSLDILELSLPNNRRESYSDRFRVTESTPLVLA